MPADVAARIAEIAAWLRENCGASAECAFPGFGRVIVFASGEFTVCV